ncbi:ATP-binding protein [Lachnospiraceae bacterium 54-53]
MELFWKAVELLMCSIEIWLFIFFCSNMLKLNNLIPIYLFVLGTSLAAFMMYILTMVTDYSSYKIFFDFFILYATVMIFFAGSMKKKTVYAILSYTILIISDLLSKAVMSFVKATATWDIILVGSIDRLAVFSMAKIIFILLIVLIISFKDKGKNNLLPQFWIGFLSCYSVIQCIVIALINAGFFVAGNERASRILAIVMLLFIIHDLFMYYFFYYLCKYFKKFNDISALEYQDRINANYILQKNDSDKILRIMSHDLKHNLILWKELASEKGYMEAQKNIIEYEQIYEANKLIHTGNKIADAIVNQKHFYARENDIQFDFRGVFHNELILTTIDLCALLGNILDNAIEAAIKVDKNAPRIIRIDIKRDGHFLILYTENSCIDSNIFLVTRKKNQSRHGIGMISLKQVVSKYEGIIENKYNDGFFKTTIILRAYDSG